MKRIVAVAAFVSVLLLGAPTVASAAAITPAGMVVVSAPVQVPDGESEPPPPTGDGGNSEPPPPTVIWRDRVDAALDRAIARVQDSSRLQPRHKQRVVRILERVQTRLQERWR